MNPKDFERVKLEPITLTKDNTHPVKFLSLKKLSEDFENIDSKIKELVLRVIAESNPADQRAASAPLHPVVGQSLPFHEYLKGG